MSRANDLPICALCGHRFTQHASNYCRSSACECKGYISVEPIKPGYVRVGDVLIVAGRARGGIKPRPLFGVVSAWDEDGLTLVIEGGAVRRYTWEAARTGYLQRAPRR